MRTIYREAEQGHWIPERAYRPGSIFTKPKVVVREIEYDPDRQFPPGATVQNKMRGKEPEYYQCNACEQIVSEHELDSHLCEGDD